MAKRVYLPMNAPLAESYSGGAPSGGPATLPPPSTSYATAPSPEQTRDADRRQRRQIALASIQLQRRLNAKSAADFAESAPMPATQEGYARRRAYINRQRATAGVPTLDAPATAVAPTADLATRAQTFNRLVANGAGMDTDKAQQLVGLAPASATSTASPYAAAQPPKPLPSEAQVAGVKTGKANIPLTIQQAKSIWDRSVEHGVGIEGYNPEAVFAGILGEYGIRHEEAHELARSFQGQAKEPSLRNLTPQQVSQVRAAPDQYGAAQQLNPYAPGNVLPGYNPILRQPTAVNAEGKRLKLQNGQWVPIEQMAPASTTQMAGR
jgi:hypothetical protein